MKILENGKGIVVGLEYFNPDDYKDLEVVGCNMTSVEHLPWEQLKKRGIKVISLKDYPTFLNTITSTAEHTIGLIIALLRNYKIALSAPYKEREIYIGHRLNEKILGIIGLGRIGRQVREIAKSFGIKVLTYDKYESKDILFDLLKVSDIVSIHITLEGNEGFFTKEMLSKMKSNACIINTSRGKIIEKGALIWALKNKIISNGAIDFCDDEEMVEYSKSHNNLILTNHLGGATYEDMQQTENFIIKQVTNYLNENITKTNNQ
jgi:D-3-phosphoglycerate dehydrogenase